MTLLQSLLHGTNFRSPILRTIVPCVSAAFAIQTAVAIPSITGQSDRFYDFSGSLTHLGVAALSLYLPALRARAAAGGGGLPSVLAAFNNPKTALFNWRQVVLTAAVSIWATRRKALLVLVKISRGYVSANTCLTKWVHICSSACCAKERTRASTR
jgi:hypothetical protein